MVVFSHFEMWHNVKRKIYEKMGHKEMEDGAREREREKSEQ